MATACQCGEITGVRCDWTGDVLVEHMPEHLRASHAKAHNRGSYPLNGSIRLRLNRGCAENLASEWTIILAEG